MKFKKNTNLFKYAGLSLMFIFVLAPNFVDGAGKVDEIVKTWIYLGVVIYAVLFFLIYWYYSKKPFAEILGNKLIIDSVEIDKSKLKNMEYLITSDRYHELKINIEGFNEWIIRLTNDRVKLKGTPLFYFIRDNFYPIKLIDNTANKSLKNGTPQSGAP